MRVLIALAAVALGGVYAGCAHRQQNLEDGWFRRATRQMFEAAAPVSSEKVHPVTNSKLSEASRLLEHVAAVSISDTTAADLANARFDPSGVYVLVRGLCAGCGTGKFYVFMSDEYLIVDHLALASRETPATRWPVVLELTDVPSDVYVQYSAIE